MFEIESKGMDIIKVGEERKKGRVDMCGLGKDIKDQGGSIIGLLLLL